MPARHLGSTLRFVVITSCVLMTGCEPSQSVEFLGCTWDIPRNLKQKPGEMRFTNLEPDADEPVAYEAITFFRSEGAVAMDFHPFRKRPDLKFLGERREGDLLLRRYEVIMPNRERNPVEAIPFAQFSGPGGAVQFFGIDYRTMTESCFTSIRTSQPEGE